jgi:hypothetical protein
MPKSAGKWDMAHTEIGRYSVKRTQVIQNRVQLQSYGHGNEASGSLNVGNFLTNCAMFTFSRQTRIHGNTRTKFSNMMNGAGKWISHFQHLNNRAICSPVPSFNLSNCMEQSSS